MHKRKLLLIAALLAAPLSGCSCETVEAGHVGIRFDLYGADKGVDAKEIGPGRYYPTINERIYTFPTFEQNYVWTKGANEGSTNDESFTFQTKEGMAVGGDFGITFDVDPTKVNVLFTTYRKGLPEITDKFLRNHVRDALNRHTSVLSVQDVYGPGKMALIDRVQSTVANDVAPKGIRIKKIYLIGTFRLPAQVSKALNAKIEATQRAQQRENELREAQAEAKKQVAAAKGAASVRVAVAKGNAEATLTEAEARAKANRILAKSITPQLIAYRRINKWNGVLPQFTGGGQPLINIGGAK